MRIARFLSLMILTGCLPGDEPEALDDEELELAQQFGPLPALPEDPTNRFADDEAAAAFGQRLFFEKGYSKALTMTGTGLGAVGDTGKISCASCHDPANYFTDTRSRPAMTSVGITWTQRNAPSLVNAVYYTWGSWGGKDDVPWNQGANGSESNSNFGGNRLNYAHVVYAKYRDDYNAIFDPDLDPALDPAAPDAARFPENGKPKAMGAADGPWEGMTDADRLIINTILANTGKALEAYERKLLSANAPIDRFLAGDETALTAAQKRGLKLFMGKAACVDCHSGPTFTDQSFHNTGVAQSLSPTAVRTDQGRYDDLARTLATSFNGAGRFSDDPEWGAAKLAGLELVDDIKGKFRTKSLRHVAETGPFMHNGAYATLADVVDFYNRGGDEYGYVGTKSPMMVPLLLDEQEQADLVQFLRALTGDPVPEAYRMDTAIAD